MTKNKIYIFCLIILTAFCGASVAIAIKIASNNLSAQSIIFYRFLFALLIITPFILKKFYKNKTPYLKISLITLLATTNITLFTIGIKYTTPNYSALIYAISPALTLIISSMLIKEKITATKILGLVLGFGGVLIILFEPLLKNGFNENNFLLGNILIFLASISYAAYAVFSKKLQKEISPEIITFIFILNTFLLSFSIVSISLTQANFFNISTSQLLPLAYAGIVGSAIFYFLHQYIIKISTPSIASTVLYIQPLITFLLSVILFKETISNLFIAGTIISLLGTYFVTQG